MGNEIAETKHEILKWMVTAIIAQTVLLVGIIVFFEITKSSSHLFHLPCGTGSLVIPDT